MYNSHEQRLPSLTITGITRKCKYYVRVRTYKIVSGTRYYSTWGVMKTVATTKGDDKRKEITKCRRDGSSKKLT